MTLGFMFALLKKFYSFQHKEILALTQDQIHVYMEQIPEVMIWLGEAERKESKILQKEDIVKMIRELGHRLPESIK